MEQGTEIWRRLEEAYFPTIDMNEGYIMIIVRIVRASSDDLQNLALASLLV